MHNGKYRQVWSLQILKYYINSKEAAIIESSRQLKVYNLCLYNAKCQAMKQDH